MPERVHLPHWSKKLCFGIKITPLHSHSAMLLAELKDNEAASSSGKGKGKGKGKDNEGPGQKRGGWLPKMAETIVAVKQEGWAAVQLSSQSYYEGSCMLQTLVDVHNA